MVATALITHRVPEGRHVDYEKWAREIAPLAKAAPGHLDRHVVRPIPGLSDTYTVVLRFDTSAHLQEWLDSPVRRRLIEKVQPVLAGGDAFLTGNRAARWKQFLVTWSAIYPLVLGLSLVVAPLLRHLGVPSHHLLSTLVVTGTAVFLMVFWVMPLYTNLVRRWLFT